MDYWRTHVNAGSISYGTSENLARLRGQDHEEHLMKLIKYLMRVTAEYSLHLIINNVMRPPHCVNSVLVFLYVSSAKLYAIPIA